MLFRRPDYVILHTESEDIRMPYSDEGMTIGDVTISLQGQVLYIRAEQTPLCYLRLRWNFTEEEIRRDDIRILGDFYECTHGILGWRSIDPKRYMPWYFMVSNGSDRNENTEGRFTECFGVKVRPGGIVNWLYDGNGFTFCADIRNGGSGVILGGRTLQVCEFVFAAFRDISAFDSGKRFCGMMCDSVNEPPYKVYGSNNWYYAYGSSSHNEILEDTRLIAKVTEGLENRPFMVVDDGWNKGNWDTPWVGGNQRFPDMPGLAKEIEELNVRPGIWVHLLYDANKNIPGEQEDWHLERNANRLDPSHPAVKDYIYRTIQLLCSWGYKLIKQDMSTADIFDRASFEMKENMTYDGWHFYDRSRTTAEIVVDFYKTIVEAAAPYACVIIGCGCLPHLAAGLFHVNRIGSDTSGRWFEQTRNHGVNAMAFRLIQNGTFYAVDGDCVGVTGEIDWYFNRQWMDLLARSGSPLFMSNKPGVLTDSELEEVHAAMAVNSVQNNDMMPMDWMENDMPRYWKIDGEIVEYDWFGKYGSGW